MIGYSQIDDGSKKTATLGDTAVSVATPQVRPGPHLKRVLRSSTLPPRWTVEAVAGSIRPPRDEGARAPPLAGRDPLEAQVEPAPALAREREGEGVPRRGRQTVASAAGVRGRRRGRLGRGRWGG